MNCPNCGAPFISASVLSMHLLNCRSPLRKAPIVTKTPPPGPPPGPRPHA